jgi:hypothetical protein
MIQTAIYGPFLVQMLLTLVVWVYMYSRRIPFIIGRKLTQADMAKPGELARLSPAAVSNPSDNLKNLFEMPVLFYALVLFLVSTQRVDHWYLAAAWAFVAFRIAHSIVHCTFNLVLLRFSLYLVASLALWFMLVRAALIYFGF